LVVTPVLSAFYCVHVVARIQTLLKEEGASVPKISVVRKRTLVLIVIFMNWYLLSLKLFPDDYRPG
jgi:hypothetical protein